MNDNITYEIKKSYGKIATYDSGWSKELNLISWNENPEKLDIRDWSPDHSHMSRGITLHKKEAEELFNLLGLALVE